MNARLLLASIAVFALTLLTWVRVAHAAWGWSSEDAYFCFELMCECDYECSRDCAFDVCDTGCSGEPNYWECLEACAIDSSNDYLHMCS